MELELPEKNSLLDSGGKPMTQSLFLELGYNDKAVFTLKEDHYLYKDKVYPSLRKLFIESEDPTEYQFATTYLLGWSHWRRMCENKVLSRHIAEWREEMELRLRSKGIKKAIEEAEKGNFNSAKWLAEKGWDKREKGRPTNAEVESERKFQARAAEEYSADVHRLFVGGGGV